MFKTVCFIATTAIVVCSSTAQRNHASSSTSFDDVSSTVPNLNSTDAAHLLDGYPTVGHETINDAPRVFDQVLQNEDLVLLFEAHPDFRQAMEEARNHCVWITERLQETHASLCALLDKRKSKGLNREETQQAILMVVKQAKREALLHEMIQGLGPAIMATVMQDEVIAGLTDLMEQLSDSL